MLRLAPSLLAGPVLFSCALAATAVVPLRAQDSAAVRIPELIVTSTRRPTPAGDVTAAATVITGEQLRAAGIQYVSDALRQVPGAEVVRGGPPGAATSLFLRGGESDYVQVLIDGVPVNQAGGAFDFGTLTTDNVEKIEIVRGPASVLYGSDAVTGVIQIFTRHGSGPGRAAASVEAGSFGTTSWAGSYRGGSENTSYSAEVSRQAGDGIYRFNNQYYNTTASALLRTAPDSKTDATISLRYSDNQYHFPTDFSGVPNDRNQFNYGNSLALGFDAGRRLSDRLEARLTLGLSTGDLGFDDTADDTGDTTGFAFASRSVVQAERRTADARLNFQAAPGVLLTSGVQLRLEREDRFGSSASNFGGGPDTSANPAFDPHRTTWGYYLQGQAELRHGLVFNAGARLDDNSGFGTFVSLSAGAAYRLATGTRFRAAAGRSFKAPTFCEQFCSEPFNRGDPSLSPERATSWEVGLEQELRPAGIVFGVTWFDQRFRNLIVYNGAVAPGEINYRNGAAARARGLEVSATARLTPRLSIDGMYTRLWSEALDDGGQPSASFAAGQELLRRAANRGHAGFQSVLLSRFTLAGGINLVGRRADVQFDPVTSASSRIMLPAYATVDLAVSADVTRANSARPGLTVTLRGTNLLDEQYQEIVGFRAPGRGVFAGAGIQF